MKATLSDGREVRLLFRHTHFRRSWHDTAGNLVTAVPRPRKKALTECVVLTYPDKQVVAHTSAACSWEDVFTKERGRQVALRRAIAELPTREDHAILWAAYTNRLDIAAQKR